MLPLKNDRGKNDYPYIIHNISKSEAIYLITNYVLENVGIYKKYSLNFQCIFLLFLFSIYIMVDFMVIYRSLNISTGTVMKNSEMLKFAPDHLKTKRVSMQLKNYLNY